VRAALEDAVVREELLRHAVARLGVLLADRPAALRRDTAAEATQEVSKRALERLMDFDPNKATPAGWLHGILNLVLHECCRNLRKQPVQPTADPGAWDELAVRMSKPDGLAELARLLDKLPEDQRQIVTLHHLEQLPHEQIAEGLGISVGNSRLRLARAMSALRELAAKEVVQ
jgi:RNA polymerase sigma-70 factor (ECF subfamily)